MHVGMQSVDASQMDQIRELDSISLNRRMDGIELDFSKAKTHLALHLIFVPPKAAVHSSIALQFRGDARRILTIVFVHSAGWKMEKTMCYTH